MKIKDIEDKFKNAIELDNGELGIDHTVEWALYYGQNLIEVAKVADSYINRYIGVEDILTGTRMKTLLVMDSTSQWGV